MFEKFAIDIEPEAFDDIQEAVDYYNSCKLGLGKIFFKSIDKCISFLERNYTAFAIRYDDIRCVKVGKYPYMIHYRVLLNQKTVSIKAVFCTYQNPEKWQKRIK